MIQQIKEALEHKKDTSLVNLPENALPYLLNRDKLSENLLILVENNDTAFDLESQIKAYGHHDVAVLPDVAKNPYDDLSYNVPLAFIRQSLRHRLLAGQKPEIMITTMASLQSYWPGSEAFIEQCWSIEIDKEISRDLIAEKLLTNGYQRVDLCEDPGTFTIRGSIIDVYNPSYNQPLRIDLFGDDIASIKLFNANTQRTTQERKTVEFYPIREIIFTEHSKSLAQQKLKSLSDSLTIPTRKVHAAIEEIEHGNYFFGIEALWPAFFEQKEKVFEELVDDHTCIFLLGIDSPENLCHDYWNQCEQAQQAATEQNRIAYSVDTYILSTKELTDKINAQACMHIENLGDDRDENVIDCKIDSWTDLSLRLRQRRQNKTEQNLLEPLEKTFEKLRLNRFEIFFVCFSQGSAERLAEMLRARRIDLPIVPMLPFAKTWGDARRQPRMAIAVAPIHKGFIDKEHKVALLCEFDIFGTQNKGQQRPKSTTSFEQLSTLKDLREGDFVIHADHGIGRYLGLKRLIVGGVDGDYIQLEYASQDKLYLPSYRVNLLSRHPSKTDSIRLDKLGGTRWLKTKARVKDAVLKIAHEILALQAKRKSLPGFAFPQPDSQYRTFEATFPFTETPDQERAIQEVLDDLVKPSPMDRLICGDVGFGKTEVAMRAAFMAVLAKKQVAILAPTTVLAEQHGERFRERFRNEAVNIEVMNRFRSKNEMQEILAKTKTGLVDIIIGTHRILSNDVHFSNLGLLVIDEEQRFGVKHKERIKQIKTHVHVLTMSATPIPRTLNMAMTGLRDISIIQTPPEERLAIRTEVTRFSENVIQEAIRRELHRGGQVFFVHNRVESIHGMAELIGQLVPEAQICVAHGQMGSGELEEKMVNFIKRRFNIMVCTTIIESGIDLPSVNTMIINRADQFGLSQLYQLRGRIGRGSDRAHAYLLMPENQRINKDAMQRLAILKRFSELGSGFNIASHDLDLRGAGDLLGADQSGNIHAVGFELYTELLHEAIEQAQGQDMEQEVEPEIKLPIPAVIPEDYVPDPAERLNLYQRLTLCQSDELIFNMCSEIAERFGPAPEEIGHLAQIMVIRRRLIQFGCIAFSAAQVENEIKVGITFGENSHIDRGDLALKLQNEPEKFKLLPSGRLAVTLQQDKDCSQEELLRILKDHIGSYKYSAEQA
ncbi:MAG: transcription-repair coupling factor [Myxococcota bacterium]|nr:transcription-repair coupling factor [Myxococcota bacterium]